jgi:hypothetical protein
MIDLYKGGVFHSTITPSTASDGSYGWDIPYDVQGGSDYKVKMTSLGDPDILDFSDDNFSIIANMVNVTSPNGGEELLLNTTTSITWTDNFSDNVRLELYKGEIPYSTIVPSTSSDGQRDWDIPSSIPVGSDYKIKITSLASDNIFDFSDENFSLKNEITVNTPNGGEIWQSGTTQIINWSDNISSTVKIELYKNGIWQLEIDDSTPNDGTKPWDIPSDLTNGSDYKLKITGLQINDFFDFSDANFTITNIVNVESISDNIPEEYILQQNYPNPFNPSTKIEFSLPEESFVSLYIYDIMGQLISIVLDKEVISAGQFRYNFDASNLTSGIYLYRIIAKSQVSDKQFNQTNKMILLK